MKRKTEPRLITAKEKRSKILLAVGVLCLIAGAILFLYASVVVAPVDNILAFRILAASVIPLAFGLFFLMIGAEG